MCTSVCTLPSALTLPHTLVLPSFGNECMKRIKQEMLLLTQSIKPTLVFLFRFSTSLLFSSLDSFCDPLSHSFSSTNTNSLRQNALISHSGRKAFLPFILVVRLCR